jgi:dinuclear metal center YbgI/SA1388 family protein
MARRDEIVKFCNDYLKVDEIKDAARNGMQIEGKEEVTRVALGVSANLELFEKAAEWGADMVIVHHGLFWEGDHTNPKTKCYDFNITGQMQKRVKALMVKNVSLLAYHHSLDVHTVIGNQAQFFMKARLRPKDEFGFYEGRNFGLYSDTKITRTELIERINSAFGTNAKLYGDGPDEVRRVGFCSGHGVLIISEAIEMGLDTFVSGSVSESTVHLAKDAKINLIAAGHYNSEKLGVQALGELIKNRFRLDVRFIETPCEV